MSHTKLITAGLSWSDARRLLIGLQITYRCDHAARSGMINIEQERQTEPPSLPMPMASKSWMWETRKSRQA